jgi:hypothetical protein
VNVLPRAGVFLYLDELKEENCHFQRLSRRRAQRCTAIDRLYPVGMIEVIKKV